MGTSRRGGLSQMKKIEPTLAGAIAYYTNGFICYSWLLTSVNCYSEKGELTHRFKVKK